MKKLLLCLCLAALTASMRVEFGWEQSAAVELRAVASGLPLLEYDADELALF